MFPKTHEIKASMCCQKFSKYCKPVKIFGELIEFTPKKP